MTLDPSNSSNLEQLALKGLTPTSQGAVEKDNQRQPRLDE